MTRCYLEDNDLNEKLRGKVYKYDDTNSLLSCISATSIPWL